ncbi:MAG: tRNA preQ1(34) S-adenosylmethionine ribosyltransferase-isomerase QueA [Candidatus Omnitrophica bacterium]|nr:tRNA preQ1(34) S-adenosylmethionine ribosyltransferase-isomerase QueA [Candidatus Omnitrophota bacterium]
MLKLSDFDYELPKKLIALYPEKERDNCKLLVVDKKEQSIKHCIFRDIKDYFHKGDLFILNNTKVLPCRLLGNRISGGRVEIFLLEHKGDLVFNAMLKPSRLKVGEKIIFSDKNISAEIISKDCVVFNANRIETVYNLGVVPLPPYIKRDAEHLDKEYYQTVYAKKEGAVASPTAGLHFTKELICSMQNAGINFGYLTLHVGAGTFKPVKDEEVINHKMDKEYFEIPDEVSCAVKQAKKNKANICAVGTTSLRALEAFAQGTKQGWTDLFIYPGFKFQLTDCLLTNFHLPRTTLFMLVCAFGGTDLMKRAYQEAIDKKYRFYSYGDAMLIK